IYNNTEINELDKSFGNLLNKYKDNNLPDFIKKQNVTYNKLERRREEGGLKGGEKIKKGVDYHSFFYFLYLVPS
ncbi:hypothetical protein CMT66_18625, partial [Elizabethkingia anophelis]|nr:hypothetical protein [Elizabethkingia anophelis]